MELAMHKGNDCKPLNIKFKPKFNQKMTLFKQPPKDGPKILLYYYSRIFYGILLPLSLFCGCFFRYNFISFIYLLLLLVAPVMPSFSYKDVTVPTKTKNFTLFII